MPVEGQEILPPKHSFPCALLSCSPFPTLPALEMMPLRGRGLIHCFHCTAKDANIVTFLLMDLRLILVSCCNEHLRTSVYTGPFQNGQDLCSQDLCSFTFGCCCPAARAPCLALCCRLAGGRAWHDDLS